MYVIFLFFKFLFFIFFFQAEDGIRDLVRSRGLGDVYKRQGNDLLVVQTSPRYLLHEPPRELQRAERRWRAYNGLRGL